MIGAPTTTATQTSLLLKHDQVKRQKSQCICMHTSQWYTCFVNALASSNVRVRKLTEEHPEVESLMKQTSNPASTVELQDDVQKRYYISMPGRILTEILIKCTYMQKAGQNGGCA